MSETTGKTTKTSTPSPSEVEEALVRKVIASFDGCTDERLKELLTSLVKHLHDFITDVRLTETEWNSAIEFLTQVGHITDDRRQEFILLSDVLGASMQTINVSNLPYKDATEATVFGPFFVDDAPLIDNGGDIAGGGIGQPCWVEGVVRDTEGNPIPGAASKCGKPMRMVSMTSNMMTVGFTVERICSPTKPGRSDSGGSPRLLTRFPMMVLSVICWRRPGDRRCGQVICTSWSPRRTNVLSSLTSSSKAMSC